MVVVPDEQYNLILDKIFKGCQRSANNGKNLRKYVSAAKRVWESSPTRFAEYLAQVFFNFLKIFLIIAKIFKRHIKCIICHNLNFYENFLLLFMYNIYFEKR